MEDPAALPPINPAAIPGMQAMAAIDDGEFDDFLSKIDQVNATIKGLKDGTIDAKELDIKEDKIQREMREKDEARARRKAAAKKEAEEKRAQALKERAEREAFREANKDKLDELKQQYYLRKARRERWVEFREQNKSRAFSDYYKGWDLFEEDPDEELFNDPSKPAAVQDQAAFDAMAKDVEERTKQRNACKEACAKEREFGNVAFKACQYTEALAAYSRAIDHFKGDKTAHANRAAAHLKLRNWLSALDDCSRVIDVSKFLDEDHSHRPPPPPVLKAYVRRATANAELERYDEAAEDLETALEMAPEAEKADIKRQQKSLKDDVAAAKRESLLTSGSDAQATAETRNRVRELLDVLRKSSEASMQELTSLFEAVSSVERAEASGKGANEAIAQAKAKAANAALKQGRTEQEASQALAELTEKAGSSAAARICIRQAGGVRLILSLLASANHPAKAADGADGAPSAPLSDEGRAARSVWAMRLAKLLCHACLERRSQLEFHVCGGTTQILRELRRIVDALQASPASAGAVASGEEEAAGGKKKGKKQGGAGGEGPTPAAAVEAASLAALAPQLNLLSICAAHETAGAELRRLAAGEGTLERLIALLEKPLAAQGGKPGQGEAASDAVVGPDLLIASAALVASLASTPRKQALVPHAKPLCAVLARHVNSSSVSLAEQAATALACLSSHTKFRNVICDGKALTALLQLLPSVPAGGAGEAVLLPNALAALHNCTLHADSLGMICTEETAKALVPRLVTSGAGSVSLARRAAAVVAKCAVRLPNVVTMVVEGKALPALVAAVVHEGKTHEEAEEAPRIVDVTDAASAAAEAEAEATAADAEEAAATEEEMVGSAVRILTACAQRKEGAVAICEGGALPCLVKLLKRSDEMLRGNAALCIANCAHEERSLAVLAVLPVVAPLLAIAHTAKGACQKNAAIALGRLAKNPRCLQSIRDNHGIEILARAMKGTMGNMGLG